MVTCYSWGFTQDHVSELVALAGEQWHREHEDVVFTLGLLEDPTAVNAVFNVTRAIPDYLRGYDGARVLVKNSIHALGCIPGEMAIRKLKELAKCDTGYVRENAERQLEHRGRASASSVDG